MLEFMERIGGRDSMGEYELVSEMCLGSMARWSTISGDSPEDPDSPESRVCMCGRSMTLGDLISMLSPSSPCENRTERGEVSVVMTEKAKRLRV